MAIKPGLAVIVLRTTRPPGVEMGTGELLGKPYEMLGGGGGGGGRRGVTCDGLTSHPEGAVILLVAPY